MEDVLVRNDFLELSEEEKLAAVQAAIEQARAFALEAAEVFPTQTGPQVNFASLQMHLQTELNLSEDDAAYWLGQVGIEPEEESEEAPNSLHSTEMEREDFSKALRKLFVKLREEGAGAIPPAYELGPTASEPAYGPEPAPAPKPAPRSRDLSRF